MTCTNLNSICRQSARVGRVAPVRICRRATLRLEGEARFRVSRLRAANVPAPSADSRSRISSTVGREKAASSKGNSAAKLKAKNLNYKKLKNLITYR